MSKRSGGNNKEESPIELLIRTYPKRFSRFGIPVYKQFDQKIRACLEEGTELTQLHLWDESNPNAVRIMFESLKQIGINTITSLRLWKIQAGDEGIRALCDYILVNNQLEVLDLLDNGITPLGCKLLGDCFHENFALLQIKKLMLDHNTIGDEGLKALANGVRRSPHLIELSLSYCGLTEGAAPYLQQILMFLNTSLESLNLQGNNLGKDGAFQTFRAIEVNTKLKELNFSDNQINDAKPLIDQLVLVIENNPTIAFINLSFNGIMQETAERLLTSVKRKMRPKIELTDRFTADFSTEFNQTMAKIKPAKDTKKKKKEAAKK